MYENEERKRREIRQRKIRKKEKSLQNIISDITLAIYEEERTKQDKEDLEEFKVMLYKELEELIKL